MSQIDTKTRILDAAEHLFARDGFHSTSLRAITGQAQVNLAAVNYHFGSKDALLQAVFERRLHPLNQIRQDLLEQVLHTARQQNMHPRVIDLIGSFIEPTLAFRQSESGAQDFTTLVGRALIEPDPTVRDCFIKLVTPLFLQLSAALQLALPQIPAEILQARLQFTLGAMGHTMCTLGRPPLELPDIPPPLPAENVAELLINFVSSGLEAAC